MLGMLKCDRPFIENKYHKTSEPFNPFSRMTYHGWDCDASTGLDDAEMKSALEAYVSSLTDTEHAVIKAKAFAYVLDHMRFTVDAHDFFPCLYNWNRPLNPLTVSRWTNYGLVPADVAAKRDELGRTGEVTSWIDYDHSVPDWNALYELGFVGIRERARDYRSSRDELTAKEAAYFDSIEIEYSAILRLIERLADYAHGCDFAKAPVIAECLDSLANGAPRTLYERLMLIYLYFMLSESVDSYQVRSLGSGFDHDIAAPYRADLASGKFGEEELDGFIGYFLMQFAAIGNYWGQPLYLGGTNLNGSTKVSEISMKLLEIYDELGLYNPKIQIKYSKNTPREFMKKVLDMIRRGHSSFVFVCEENIKARMLERGLPYERIYDFDVKGCYEYALRAGEFSTAPYYVNLLAPIVKALERVSDDASYDEIYAAYEARVREIFENGVAYCRAIEVQLADVNPSPMLSATITSSLEKARDAYHDGSELNTTAFVVGALGSAVDSLMAIKSLVFDEKCVTLGELKRILAENWSDAHLRARALACKHKYGCGDPASDALARKIIDIVLDYQGLDNYRNGYFKIAIHSARQFIELGAKTPATPDGRLAGDETSKNASPVIGMDRNGVTALIRSACELLPDACYEGFGFDVMLHESAVRGDDGLDAMYALLLAYEAGHGSSIQFNVCSAETLREAQEHPEKYRNLQIRVCGWNVLWNNMPKSEQDKYIERAENIV